MKTLRCLRCHRSLVRFTISIPTSNGLRGWGSTCARYVTITPTRHVHGKPHVSVRRVGHAGWRDPAQTDWIEALAA